MPATTLEAASEREAVALRQLLDVATDLSKDSLLVLLRRCGGDADAAMAQLWSLTETAGFGDHMAQHGSTEYQLTFDDEDEDGEAPQFPSSAEGDDDEESDAEGGMGNQRQSTPSAEARQVSATVVAVDESGSSSFDLLTSSSSDGGEGSSFDEAACGEVDSAHAPTTTATEAPVNVAEAASSIRRLSMIVGSMVDADGIPSFLNEGVCYINWELRPAKAPTAPRTKSSEEAEEEDRSKSEQTATVLNLNVAIIDEGAFAKNLSSWFREGATAEAAPAPQEAADPNFDAYLNAVLNETPEQRTARIAQERLDAFLAQQLMEEDVMEMQFDAYNGVSDEDTKLRSAAPAAPRAAASDTDGAASKTAKLAPSPAGPVEVKVQRFAAAPISLALPPSCSRCVVQNIVNDRLQARFAEAAFALQSEGLSTTVEIAFHGTTGDAAARITQGGFIAPMSEAGRSLVRRSGSSGYYGNGIYLSPNPDVARAYAATDKLLVCNVLRGRPYHCPGVMLGAPCTPHHTSHTSPDGSQWVFFNSAFVLPVALLHFHRDGSVASVPADGSVVKSQRVWDTTTPSTKPPAPVSTHQAARPNARTVKRVRRAAPAPAPSRFVHTRESVKVEVHVSNKVRKARNRAEKKRR